MQTINDLAHIPTDHTISIHMNRMAISFGGVVVEIYWLSAIVLVIVHLGKFVVTERAGWGIHLNCFKCFIDWNFYSILELNTCFKLKRRINKNKILENTGANTHKHKEFLSPPIPVNPGAAKQCPKNGGYCRYVCVVSGFE